MRILKTLLPAVLLTVAVASRAQDTTTSSIPPPAPPERPVKTPASGFQWIPKFGIGQSRNFLLDLGIVGYSYIPDKHKAQYFDANISLRGMVGKYSMLMPKLDLQAGLLPLDPDELICFNLGLDAGMLTDFRHAAVMLVPKAGFSAATGLIRLYYLHQFLLGDRLYFPGYGRHGVMLEINISVLQGKGFRLQ